MVRSRSFPEVFFRAPGVCSGLGASRNGYAFLSEDVDDDEVFDGSIQEWYHAVIASFQYATQPAASDHTVRLQKTMLLGR